MLWTWEIARKAKVPESGWERVQKVFWTPRARGLLHWCEMGLHRCKRGFGWCKRLLGSLGPRSQKDLLQTPLTTFGDFPFLGNFPGAQHPKPGIVVWPKFLGTIKYPH